MKNAESSGLVGYVKGALPHGLKKRLRKALGLNPSDRQGFEWRLESSAESGDRAREVARQLRGSGRKPALILQGVAPRSGTNYVGALLKLHPDLCPYPNDMWEVPFLEVTGDLLAAEEHFFRAYPKNRDRIGKNDFLTLFGSSLIAFLHSFVPENQRMLIKVPDVQYLSFFYSVYPFEDLLLVMRDGRDVVNSTVTTWPGMNFAEVCRFWNDGAKMMMRFRQHYVGSESRWWYTRYEEIIQDPERFIREACRRFALDESRYPFAEMEKLPVIGASGIPASRSTVDGVITWSGVEKPENFKPVGKWQQWDQRQKDIFKKIAGRTLIDLGYTDDLNW